MWQYSINFINKQRKSYVRVSNFIKAVRKAKWKEILYIGCSDGFHGYGEGVDSGRDKLYRMKLALEFPEKAKLIWSNRK